MPFTTTERERALRDEHREARERIELRLAMKGLTANETLMRSLVDAEMRPLVRVTIRPERRVKVKP